MNQNSITKTDKKNKNENKNTGFRTIEELYVLPDVPHSQKVVSLVSQFKGLNKKLILWDRQNGIDSDGKLLVWNHDQLRKIFHSKLESLEVIGGGMLFDIPNEDINDHITDMIIAPNLATLGLSVGCTDHFFRQMARFNLTKRLKCLEIDCQLNSYYRSLESGISRLFTIISSKDANYPCLNQLKFYIQNETKELEKFETILREYVRYVRNDKLHHFWPNLKTIEFIWGSFDTRQKRGRTIPPIYNWREREESLTHQSDKFFFSIDDPLIELHGINLTGDDNIEDLILLSTFNWFKRMRTAKKYDFSSYSLDCKRVTIRIKLD